MHMKFIELKRNGDLCDPEFGGYKLSLAGVGVSSVAVPAVAGVQHKQPGSEEFSFLHAKLYGEHNHLAWDPWDTCETVYWVAAGGAVYRLRAGQVERVLEPGPGGAAGPYNSRILFLGPDLVAVSDGAGGVRLLGSRSASRPAPWSLLFSEAVCGTGRPCLVVGGEVGEGGREVELLVQYVEERGRVEGAGQSGDSSFLTVLEWIGLSLCGTSYVMERVRRLVCPGGLHTAAVLAGRLVLAAEKRPSIVFDSQQQLESELSPAEVEAAVRTEQEEEQPQFYWRQAGEDLELWCYGGESLPRTAFKVSLAGDRLEVKAAGSALLAGQLWAAVEEDSWTWTWERGRLGVLLTKVVGEVWPGLWGAGGGTAGHQVEDQETEDPLPSLAGLTTSSPILPEPDNMSSLNCEQLEECDNCDSEDLLVWLGGEDELGASLAGQQHLASLPCLASSAPAILTRHDVDGLVWSLGSDSVEHTATFPALGYVQASKTSRKFLTAAPGRGYCVISDSHRHLYLYRQPELLPVETELRNRRSGQRVDRVAKQVSSTSALRQFLMNEHLASYVLY